MKKVKLEKLEKIKNNPGRIDGHAHVGLLYKNYLQYAYPYCLSFEDLIIRMDHFGTKYSIVFGVDSSYYQPFPGPNGVVKTSEEFSSFPYEIENANLLKEIYEVFPEYSDRVFPFLLFDPSRKAEEQARNIDDLCSRFPVFGVKTIPTYIQAFIKDIETIGAPILDVIQKRNLSITFHCSWHKGDPWANIYDIIEFVERHPELSICIAHSARFCQDILERADKLPNCYVDLSAFDIHCQLAVANSAAIPPVEQRFQADYANPEQAMKQLVDTYPDTMIWGTDQPYNYFIQKVYTADGSCNDTVLKSSKEREYQILDALPEDSRQKITFDNTIRFIEGGLN